MGTNFIDFIDSYLQVIFRGIYWARFWLQLSEEEVMKAIKNNCQQLEATILEFFTGCGWNFKRRIAI